MNNNQDTTTIKEKTTLENQNQELKKDHSIGAGSGALAGAITGGTAGTILGPVGTVVGAAAGAVLGAKVGDEVAEMINPTTYTTHFEQTYQTRPYYNEQKTWNDYRPAYQYGYETKQQHMGEKFESVENKLKRDWEEAKMDGQLAWSEAREAVRDGWHFVERKLPGDYDRDGR